MDVKILLNIITHVPLYITKIGKSSFQWEFSMGVFNGPKQAYLVILSTFLPHAFNILADIIFPPTMANIVAHVRDI